MSRKYYIDDVLSDSGSDEVSLSDLTLARDVFSDLPVDTDCVNSRSVDVLYERSHHRRKQQRNDRDEERPREVSRQSGISDFSLSESLSTIPVASEAPEAPRSVKEVYRELHSINEKLRKEFKLLHERDEAVREKEASLKDKELSLKKTAAKIERHIEMETTRKLQAAEELHRLAMEKLEILLKEKIRENKRQRENFDMLKSANDTLHKELDTLQTQHGKLEKQFTSLQARLTNLQRKRNFEENKHSGQQALATLKKQGVVKDTSKAVTARQKQTSLHTHQVMAVLLQWIADVHLRQAVTEQPTKPLEGACSQEFIQEKCFRVLPYLVDMLQELPAGSTSPVSLPCLQFTYWSLLHIDLIPGQKGGVTVSLRRLGEELYRPAKQILSGGDNSPQDGVRHRDLTYIQSSDLPVRFVSSLIILKTDTQVDHLAYVCGILKTDLKTDNGKELFLYYQATSTILTHVKTSNKLLVNLVTDIYLQMAIESPLLPNFLMSCSNEAWFRSVSLIWRMPSVEVKLLEKMSIILQKLSKMKQNKRYFEVFGISSSCSEMLRTMGNENPFLVLNVKSILFNLSSEKVPSKSLISSG